MRGTKGIWTMANERIARFEVGWVSRNSAERPAWTAVFNLNVHHWHVFSDFLSKRAGKGENEAGTYQTAGAGGGTYLNRSYRP